VCNNAKLRDFIASNVDKATAAQYSKSISQIRTDGSADADGMVMQKEELNKQESVRSVINGAAVAVGVVVALVVIFILVRRRKKTIE
jgi:cobaltochelatase CobN